MISKGLCIFCASTLPFIFSLNGEFVFDDSEAITNNADVYSGSWTDLFTHDFWGNDIQNSNSHKSYRPLTILTFRMNYFINNEKLSALHFKVTNLLFHISCCFILWKTFENIIKEIDAKKRPNWFYDRAFLATLLFAVHPVHTEAVSGIVGRADVLAGNTFFLTLLLYQKAMINSDLSYAYYFGALISAAMSMLFKETGITALGVCICYEIIKFNVKRTYYRRNKKVLVSLDFNSVMRLIGTAVAIFLFLFARWKVMGGAKPEFQSTDNPAAFSGSILTKILTYNYIYFLNVLLLVWPHWLCYDWSMGCIPLVKHISDTRLVFVILMYIYGILVLKALFNKNFAKGTRRLMLIAILMAVFPFLPASNIFYPVGFVVAERVLYISSAGYCLFITLGFIKLVKMSAKRRKICLTFFVLLVLIWSLKTYRRADDWRKEYDLYSRDVSVCPLNAKIHYNIAKVNHDIHKHKAIAAYSEAIRLHPRYYQALNNLGNLLKAENRYEQAELYFKTALKIKRDFPAAWMNLGIVLGNLNRNEEAEAAYKVALQLKKEYSDCYYNLGNLYLQMNSTQQALESWLQAVRLNTTNSLAWHNLLQMINDTGDAERARKLIPKALEAMPDSPSVHFAVANIYGKAEEFALAEKHFKMAIKLFGKNAKAIHYGNLGVLYHRWQKYPMAATMYKKAIKLDPNYEAGRQYLKNLEAMAVLN